MFLIGSRALYATCPDFPRRKNSDWDIVLEPCEDRPEVLPEGVEIVESGSEELDNHTLEICTWAYSFNQIDTPLGKARYIMPQAVQLMKRSHLFRERGFQKHIRDYHWLKARHSGSFQGSTPNYWTLLNEHTRLHKVHFGDRTPSLRKSKAKFFDDSVPKLYDHDDIHRATCYGPAPLFERLHAPGAEVYCDPKEWEKFSHEEKVRTVREEGFTIAIERYLLHRKGYPPTFAFSKAIERICTTLTGGFFRDFAIENWPEVMKLDVDFWQKFRDNEPRRLDDGK